MISRNRPVPGPAMHRRTLRRGTTLPVVTVLLVFIVSMVAFAVDVGYVAHERTEMQAAADAGALAGLARLYSASGSTQDYVSASAEVRKFVGGSSANMSGFNVAESDIRYGFFDRTAAVGSRFSTTLGTNPANALQVVLRRDGATNPKLDLFFAPVLGKKTSQVTAQATAWMPPGLGIMPDSPVIPYVAHVDYFNAAAGITPRPDNSPGFRYVSGDYMMDEWSIGAPGTTPAKGSDGQKEFVLFSNGSNLPGNFGSIDLGSASNGTPELARQLRYGPNAADFSTMNTGGKLAGDGTLQAPVTLGGDTGISNGVKDDWADIVGQNKIIPLYDTLSGNGNNAAYHIVGFAGVRIVAVDLEGNPKRVWVQPTSFYSNRVTGLPPNGSGTGMSGVYAPPRLVIP